MSCKRAVQFQQEEGGSTAVFEVVQRKTRHKQDQLCHPFEAKRCLSDNQKKCPSSFHRHYKFCSGIKDYQLGEVKYENEPWTTRTAMKDSTKLKPML